MVRAPASNKQCCTRPDDRPITSRNICPHTTLQPTSNYRKDNSGPLFSVMSAAQYSWGVHLKFMSSWHRSFRNPATHGPGYDGLCTSPKPLAGIIIVQHIWVVVPTPQDLNVRDPQAFVLGSTETPAAIYKLVIALQVLRAWAENHPSRSCNCSSKQQINHTA